MHKIWKMHLIFMNKSKNDMRNEYFKGIFWERMPNAKYTLPISIIIKKPNRNLGW